MPKSEIIDFSVEVDISGIEDRFTDLCKDNTTRLEINNKFVEFCDPYVPMLNGPLSESAFAQVTPERIKYGGAGTGVPYARYQYYGVNFNHTVEWHPKATALWDKAMMQERGEEFAEEVRNILVRRYKELYG